MSQRIEQEIRGPSESASQGLFSHQISRLGRQIKLPKRFEQNVEVLPIPKAGVRKKTIKKRATYKQPTIEIYEDDTPVAEVEAGL
jgi:hypothetical protein